MGMLKLVGLCAACLAPLVLLRKGAPEQALLLTVCVLGVAGFCCVEALTPLFDRLCGLLEQSGISRQYYSILFRVAGISLISRLCGDLCRDNGSQALGSVVDIAGTAGALVVSMPLLEAVAELLLGYFT